VFTLSLPTEIKLNHACLSVCPSIYLSEAMVAILIRHEKMETVSITCVLRVPWTFSLAVTVMSTHTSQNHHDVEVYSGWTRCKSDAVMIMWI